MRCGQCRAFPYQDRFSLAHGFLADAGVGAFSKMGFQIITIAV
jgi:hypothetical protein